MHQRVEICNHDHRSASISWSKYPFSVNNASLQKSIKEVENFIPTIIAKDLFFEGTGDITISICLGGHHYNVGIYADV